MLPRLSAAKFNIHVVIALVDAC